MDPRIVYLIHFEKPLHHAKHYLGSTTDLAARLSDHRSGNGARLMEVIAQAGIGWSVVRIWKGSRQIERRIKNRKAATRLCPVCAGAKALKRCIDPTLEKETKNECE